MKDAFASKPLPNVAEDQKYLEACEKRATILFRTELKEDCVKQDIGFGYTRLKTAYRILDKSKFLHGNDSIILDSYDREVFAYRCYDCDNGLCSVIERPEGNLLFYKTDLLGYSVFNLSDHMQFRYIPQSALDQSESFIWTAVHYNHIAGIMAVDGCYWAYPGDVFIYDMQNPMTLYKMGVNLRKAVGDLHYGQYNDIEFVRWAQNALYVQCYDESKGIYKKFIFSLDNCRNLLYC